MKRKVVLHGPSTFTISLPAKWVQQHCIKKGDELEVEMFDKCLKVTTKSEEIPLKKIEVDFSNLQEYAINTLMAVLHKSGYDEITIIYNTPQTLMIIQERIYSMLIGFEILEQTNTTCLVKNVAKDGPKEFANFLRRTFLVTKSLADESLNILKTKHYDKIDEALKLEKTNNRLSNYCHRLLNRGNHMTEKSTYSYIIIWILESICDDYKNILEFTKKNPGINIPPTFLDSMDKVGNLFSEYYNLYYRFDVKKLDELRTKQETLEQEILNLIHNEDSAENASLVYLHNIINRIKDALASTAGLNY
ncbi:MAG: hypothetical protein KKG59_01535 [Nanoarchaeota archaeon]|nr:hypothetical protein [Nanoarchaeota archaeon]